MASDAAIFVRIDSKVKADAEAILKQLGVTPSSAILMFYNQIILTGGVPFDVRLPLREPIAIGDMSDEDVMKIVKTGVDDAQAGRVYTLEEVEQMLKKRYGH